MPGIVPFRLIPREASVKWWRGAALQGRFGLAMTMDKAAKSIFRQSPVARRGAMLAFALGGTRSAVLMGEFWNADLRDLGNQYKMPVYCVMGDRDRTHLAIKVQYTHAYNPMFIIKKLWFIDGNCSDAS